MRIHPARSFFTAFLILLNVFFMIPKVRAQQESAPAKPPANSGASQPVAGKNAQTQTQAPQGSETSSGQRSVKSHDGSEILRKRAEWFYRQRASVHGRIPGGAYQSAFQHLQRMLRAEGKFAENSATPASFTNPSPFPAWTPIGPTPTTGGEFSPVTGRVLTIAVDPSDASGNTVLLGGAMGGIWRSTDAGASWTAVGDQNASLAMGSIAFAPSNPSMVYAGTGEADAIGFDVYYGAGVLKSTDHGQTWTQTCGVASSTCPFIGPYSDVTPFGFFTLGGTRISYVSVNPSNPQMVLVGAETQFAEGATEGVYCSDNAGTTWSNILPGELSSFVGFASSTVAYAALGNPFGSSQGAPNGNGIYKATGIGSTCATIHFLRLTSATLPPQSSMGRIDIGISPSDSSGNTLYASIADSSQGSITNLGVFLSSNGGTSWTRTNAPDVCQQQCWYDNVVKADSQGSVFLAGSAVTDSSGAPSWVVRSSNSGTSWSSIIPNLPLGSSPGLPHVDNHALAFVKLSTGKIRLYLGNDGGIWRTDDAEAASVQWTNLNNPSLTLTQFYPSISISPSTPDSVFGGTQDNGSQNYQGALAWQDNQQCGDGGSTAVDALIPSTVYIGCITGFPVNASYQSGALGTFFPAVNGINPADSFILPPLATDPNFGSTVYFGTTQLYQSIDAGNNWTNISGVLVNGSPDLLTAIAVAPGAPQVAYVGATNGLLFGTANLSQGSFANFLIKGSSVFPPRALTSIAIDPADPTGNTLYVAFSGFSFVNSNFGVNDPTGHIFKSVDGAATFVDVSCSVAAPANCSAPAASDLPNIPVNDIVVDPDIPNVIYAATDLGVFIGNCSSSPCTWSTLGTALPRATVLSLRLHEPSRTLVAGTHGRGAWKITLNNFTFSGPHIASITPISTNAGGTSLTLTVNGSGLTGGTIQFGATALTSTGVSSDTSLSGTVPTSLLIAGVPPITVKVASQTSNAIPFSVLGSTPSITSITPASAPVQTPTPANNVAIKINGTGFSSSAKVLWNGAQNGITVAAPTASCPLPTCLMATLPANLLGPFGSTNDVIVSNLPPGGGKSKAQAFKVVAPAPPNDNFANATNITTLNFSDVQDSSGATTEATDPLLPASCITQFPNTANTGGHPNGDYNTIWYKFTPQFSAPLSIDTSGSSYDTVLSIWTGTQGSLTQVACNDDINPGIVTQSQLTSVPLTASTTYYIMVSSFGPPDPNPIGLGGSSNFHFQYNFGLTPAPVITSISPSSVNSGAPAFALTVNGSNFVSGAVVDINNSSGFGNALVPSSITPAQIVVTVPAANVVLPGAYTIGVVNPVPTDGPSNLVPFTVNVGTYPVPVIGAISPATIVAGSIPFTIVASCQNCASTAFLSFNGVPKASAVSNSFSSPFQQNVSAQISTADIGTAGTVQVTVSNPTPGGGPSASLPFVIAQPTVVPTITSVTPSSGSTGTFLNITITGTGFLPTAVVNLAGIFYSTNVVSSTQITSSVGTLPAPGTYPLYVIDQPPAGTSAAFTFTVTGPPDFTLTTSGTTSQTVNAGTTATYTNVVSVSPQNGFTAAVNLDCSVIATATRCSVNPTSLTNGSATVQSPRPLAASRHLCSKDPGCIGLSQST